MTEKELKILNLKNRIKKIESKPGAMKTPGVLNKLKSKLKTIESEK